MTLRFSLHLRHPCQCRHTCNHFFLNFKHSVSHRHGDRTIRHSRTATQSNEFPPTTQCWQWLVSGIVDVGGRPVDGSQSSASPVSSGPRLRSRCLMRLWYPDGGGHCRMK